MVWYHLSEKLIKDVYDIDCKKQTKSYFKPFGFWISKNSEWETWLNENFEGVSTWGYKYKYKITFRRNINVLKILTFDDMKKFTEKYGVKYKGKNKYMSANWKKVCEDYDGIFFENYDKIRSYLWKNELIDIYSWYLSLDVNSACIFRPSEVISKITQVELKEYFVTED
jgi:hypothetical protein